MTDQAQPKELTELPKALQIDNAFMLCGWPMSILFYFQMWIASCRDKRRGTWRWSPPPVLMQAVTMEAAPVEFRHNLHERGVPTASAMLQWVLVGGKIGMELMWFVPGHQKQWAETIHNRYLAGDPIPQRGPTVQPNNLDMAVMDLFSKVVDRNRATLGKTPNQVKRSGKQKPLRDRAAGWLGE